MNSSSASKAKAVAWLVLSPIAVLMALVSTVESQTTYFAQIVTFGTWSGLGMTSAVASLAGAKWAHSLQRALALVAVSYFGIAGVVMVSFLAAALLSGGAANAVLGWSLTALVLILVVVTVFRARAARRRSVAPHSDA